MSYILGVVGVILFFVILHYFSDLDNRQKISITLFVLIVVSSAVLYNNYAERERERIVELELNYIQNKNMICDGVEVNQSNFEYSQGTQVFIGKKNSPHYERIISITQCQ